MDGWNFEILCGISRVTYSILMENNVHEESLKLASEYNNLEMVARAVGYGADARVDNDYALRQALRHGNMEMTAYLMKNGAGDIHGDVYGLITGAREDCV